MTNEELDKLGLEVVPEPPKESLTSRVGTALKNLYLGPPVVQETVKGLIGRVPGEVMTTLGKGLQYVSQFAPQDQSKQQNIAPEFRTPTEKIGNIGLRKIGEILRGAGELQRQKFAPVEGYAEEHPVANWIQEQGEGLAPILATAAVPGGAFALPLVMGAQQGQTSFENAKIAHPEWTDDQALQASIAPAVVTGGGFALFPTASKIGKGLAGKAFKPAMETVENVLKPGLAQRIAQKVGGATTDAVLMQAQAAGTAQAEKVTGARPTASPWDEVIANPAAWGTAFLLGGMFQGLDTLKQATMIRTMRTALNNPEVAPEVRATAALHVKEALAKVHPELADAWDRHAAEKITGKQAIPFDTSFSKVNEIQKLMDKVMESQEQARIQQGLEGNYPGRQPEGFTGAENTPLPTEAEQAFRAATREGTMFTQGGVDLGALLGAQRGVDRENPFIKEGLGLGEINAVTGREGVAQAEPARTLENVQGEGAHRNEQALAETPRPETDIRDIEKQGIGITEGLKGKVDTTFTDPTLTKGDVESYLMNLKEYNPEALPYAEAKAKERFPDISFDLANMTSERVMKPEDVAEMNRRLGIEVRPESEVQTRSFEEKPFESPGRELTSIEEQSLHSRLGDVMTSEEIKAPATSERKGMIEALNNQFSKKFEKELGMKESSAKVDEATQQFAALSGHKIVLLDNAEGNLPFRGFYPGSGDYVFINARADRPQLVLFGHELIHIIRAKAPEVYDALAKDTDVINDADLLKTYGKVYPERGDALRERVKGEALANLAGEKLLDPTFLTKIGDKNPALFQRITAFISDLLATIRNSISTKKAWAEGKFSDLQKAEDATATAIAKFHEKYGAEQAGAATEAQKAYALRMWETRGTDSPFFRKWFGESKVLDAEGKPLVVYHGTAENIDPSFTGDMIFFTSSKFLAGQYAAETGSKGTAIIGNKYFPSTIGSNIVPAYLRLNNPLIIDAVGGGKDIGVYRGEIREAKNSGKYDGVIIKNVVDTPKGSYSPIGDVFAEGDVFIAFKPEQIKSIWNSGEFNPETANISYALKDHLSKITDNKDVKTAVDNFKDAIDGLKLLVRPESLSEGAQLVADVHRAKQGAMNQNLAKAYTALDSSVPKEHVTGVAKLMDIVQSSSWLHIDKIFNKMTPEERDGFRQWMDTGVAPPGFNPTESLVGIGAAAKDILRGYAERVQGLGIGYLDFVREFYWPHYRDVTTEERLNQVFANISKRPAEGAKKFAHERVYEDYFAFKEAGIKNLYDNPLDEMFAKIGEMGQFILTHDTAQTVYQMAPDLIFPVKMSEPTPPDHTELTKRFSKGFVMQHISPDGRPLVDEAGRPLDEIRYRWVMRNDVAPIFDNYLAKGLYGNKYIGKPFEAYMKAGNTLNQWQLGVGSAFHAGFTTMEAVISHQALGIQQISEGKFAEGLKTFVEAPKQIWRNPIIGNAIYKLWKGEGPEAKWMGVLNDYGVNEYQARKAVEMMGLGGFRPGMDARFVTNHTQKMMKAWAEGDKGKALLRSPFAFVEQTARPIMEWLVPRQKIGVFSEEVFKYMDKNPNATHEEVLRESNDIMDRIDSRLGQVNYDRLFVRPTTKNIAQALLRAPGWTGGTIFEVGGGMVDAVGWAKGILSGDYKPMSRRMSYTVSLITTTAIINGLLTYLFTGEAPDTKDMFAFRTGEKDEQGRDQRFMLPTYMKDVHAWYTQTGKTATNKLHPAIGLINDILSNKDYYGTEINHPDDPIYVRTIDNGVFIAKQFTPFWMRGLAKEKQRKSESPISYIGPIFGIMPAPSDFYMSSAERHMYEVMASARGESKQTKEEFQRKQIVNQLIIERRRGEDSGLLASAKNEGILRPRDIKDIAEKASTKPFIRNFTHMRFQDAAAVYQLATPEERALINAIFIKKLHTFKKNGSPEEIEDMKGKYPEWNW